MSELCGQEYTYKVELNVSRLALFWTLKRCHLQNSSLAHRALPMFRSLRKYMLEVVFPDRVKHPPPTRLYFQISWLNNKLYYNFRAEFLILGGEQDKQEQVLMNDPPFTTLHKQVSCRKHRSSCTFTLLIRFGSHLIHSLLKMKKKGSKIANLTRLL